MDFGLSGRTVLVTGGTGGIGREIVRAFAAEGARVAVGYHTAGEAARKLAAESGTAMAVRYALEDPGSGDSAVAEIEERWGPVEVLVTSAMRWGPRRSPATRFEDVPDGDWRPVLEHNIAPVVDGVRRVMPGMRRSGWGRIALISSHNAAGGNRGQEYYGAAKAALHGFARSLAWDAGPDGILVNVVAPGLTMTDRVRDGLPAPVRERELANTPSGRLSDPADVANAVVFLCSAANGNITGETLTVSGGR
jgi:3-oxoacyl-[acyl-carrier protein] reductase